MGTLRGAFQLYPIEAKTQVAGQPARWTMAACNFIIDDDYSVSQGVVGTRAPSRLRQ